LKNQTGLKPRAWKQQQQQQTGEKNRKTTCFNI
jgi:hypothetical protein